MEFDEEKELNRLRKKFKELWPGDGGTNEKLIIISQIESARRHAEISEFFRQTQDGILRLLEKYLIQKEEEKPAKKKHWFSWKRKER